MSASLAINSVDCESLYVTTNKSIFVSHDESEIFFEVDDKYYSFEILHINNDTIQFAISRDSLIDIIKHLINLGICFQYIIKF